MSTYKHKIIEGYNQLTSFDQTFNTSLTQKLTELYDNTPSKLYTITKFSYGLKGLPYYDFSIDIGKSPTDLIEVRIDDTTISLLPTISLTPQDYNPLFNMMQYKNTYYYTEIMTFGDAFIVLNGSRPKNTDYYFTQLLTELCKSALKLIQHKNNIHYKDALKDTQNSICALPKIMKKYAKHITDDNTILSIDIFYAKHVELKLITPNKYIEKNKQYKDYSDLTNSIEKILKRSGLY